MNIQGLSPLTVTGFYLFAAQGALRSLLQHHSSKASVIQRSAFFMVQLSQPYVTTGKTIALTIQTAVGRVMSLLNFPAKEQSSSDFMAYLDAFAILQYKINFKNTNYELCALTILALILLFQPLAVISI